jgi:hypothetical protein
MESAILRDRERRGPAESPGNSVMNELIWSIPDWRGRKAALDKSGFA